MSSTPEVHSPAGSDVKDMESDEELIHQKRKRRSSEYEEYVGPMNMKKIRAREDLKYQRYQREIEESLKQENAISLLQGLQKHRNQHSEVILEFVWELYDQLFISCPETVSQLMIDIHRNPNAARRCYTTPIVIVDRFADFPDEFITFLANDGYLLNENYANLNELSKFSTVLKETSPSFSIDSERMGRVFQVVTDIKYISEILKEKRPVNLCNDSTKNAYECIQNLLIEKYITTIFKIVEFAENYEGAQQNNLDMRLDLVANGMKMFLFSGGFVQLLTKIRGIGSAKDKKFRRHYKKYYAEISKKYNLVRSWYSENARKLYLNICKHNGLTLNDVTRIEAETRFGIITGIDGNTCWECYHHIRMSFATQYAYDIHKKLHPAVSCITCSRRYNKATLLLHNIVAHFGLRFEDYE